MTEENAIRNILIADLTDDQDMQELARLYWQRDDDGKFARTVSSFAPRFSLKPRDVAQVLREHCHAYFEDEICICGEPPAQRLMNRSDVRRGWHTNNGCCESCQARADKAKRARDAERAKEQLENKTSQMSRAFEYSTYESLNKLEFNLLIALVTEPGLEAASKRLGLSYKNGLAIFKKFNEMHLINWGVGIKGYAFHPPLKEALRKIGLQRSVKSIFGSPRALDLYRKLKQEHLFVYPEIPMCAFINRDTVEHLFTEDWHSSYFLMCRLDFVICDHAGAPEFAIEYQGSYHESRKQKEKDDFKRMVLAEVGLSLREVAYKELKDFTL